MIGADLSAVFADSGKPATLRKQDGSASTASTGLYDEAELEHQTERGSMSSKQPQFTVPADIGKNYTEGDTITANGITYEILDADHGVFKVAQTH